MAAVIAHPRSSFSEVEDYSSWTNFLEGGSEGVSDAVILEGGRRVKLSWLDGHFSEFSLKWLRDHSTGSFNVSTKQREVDTFSIANATRVKHASVETLPSAPSPDADTTMDTDKTRPQQVLRLRWDAGGIDTEDEECTVPITRLRQHCNSETARNLRQQFGTLAEVAHPDPSPVLWGQGVLSSPTGNSSPARFEYKEIMEDNEQSSPASSASSSSPQTATSQLRGRLTSHGIALVRGVPTDVAASEALGLKLGGHLMGTLYGKSSWDISTDTLDPDTLFRNLSYTNDALALHTEGAFLSEPPGLQVLSCQLQASEGGAGIYVDGFAVAERLRKEHPQAFDFFTTTSLTYQYFDAGYHYVGDGPIFRIGTLGVVDQVRYSDIYRAPLDYLSADDIDRFYEHHEALIAITRDPAMVERVILEPGDTIVFNNQRTLHGRESYKGARRMVGCYVGRDEANSEARMKDI